MNEYQLALLKALQKKKKELSKSAKKSRKFLIELGVVDKHGNLTEPYKNLQLPPREK